MDSKDLVGNWIEEKCPKCGATLLENKRGDKWCSNAGGTSILPCTFGLDEEA